MPSSGEALTRKDTPLGGCPLYGIDLHSRRRDTAVHNKHDRPELEFVSSTGAFLMSGERAREAQVFFRFQKVWLDAEGLFVMSNG